MITYSNPRMYAEVPDWPSGKHRVIATFYVETTTRGERTVRVTTGQPVKLTYARRMRIVDGDDGRTYIVCDQGSMVSVMRGDMKYKQEVAHSPGDRFGELLKLFDEPWSQHDDRIADHIDGYDRDDLGESPDY